MRVKWRESKMDGGMYRVEGFVLRVRLSVWFSAFASILDMISTVQRVNQDASEEGPSE